MKPAALACMLLLLVASTVHAQLTVLPQIGFDRTRTSMKVNDARCFSPMGAQTSLKASIRFDYRFKQGHGPFIGVGTSPAVVSVDFTNPADAMNTYKAGAGAMQWRLEAGYQYTSKPIFFSGPASQSTTVEEQKTVAKTSCGSYSYSRCGSKRKLETVKNQGLNMRLQPSLGIAYIPSVEEDLQTKGTTYQYNAGNWRTALVSGLGFEFGKGNQRLLTLGVYFTKGLGNGGDQSITTDENGKSTVTNISSRSSSWGLTLGVPFSLVKKNPSVKIIKKKQAKSGCRSRCIRQILN